MCVSIGLTIGKVPVVGVVYNPIMDEVRIVQTLIVTSMSLAPTVSINNNSIVSSLLDDAMDMNIDFLYFFIDKTAIHWCPRERSLLEWKTN